jgi:hypothetical protein
VADQASSKRDAAQPAYFPGLRMTCGADGVPLVEMHDGAGGPITSGAAHHEAWVDAFRTIARDRADGVVILAAPAATGCPRSTSAASAASRTRGLVQGARRGRAGDGQPSQHPSPLHLAPGRVAWMLNAEHDDRDRATRRDEVMPNAAPRGEKPRPRRRRHCHRRSHIIPQAEWAS